MHFGNCNVKNVLTFRIEGARQDESPLLVQILNIQKSISVVQILPTLFWLCTDISPDRTYLDAPLRGFLHSQSLVDPLDKEKVFVSVFPSIVHSFGVNDVIQAGLNSVVDIIEGYALLVASLNVVTKLLAEGTLSMVVWEVDVDWCRFSNI